MNKMKILLGALVLFQLSGNAESLTNALDSYRGMLKEGKPLIVQAAIDNDAERVTELVQANSDVNAGDDSGRSALMWASLLGNAKAAAVLIDSGADLDKKDERGSTALMNAAEAGRTAVMRLLLDAGANPEASNRMGYTPLMYAAKDGQLSAIRVLVEHGVDLNARNKTGATALIVAVITGQIDSIALLVELGADTSIQSNAGLRAADYAENSRNKEALLKALRGEHKRISGQAAVNAVRLVKELCRQASVNVSSAVSELGDDAFVDKWNREIFSLFINEKEVDLLRDFFSGSVLLGAAPEAGGQVALAVYNPWSDCLLLLESQNSKFTDFAFVAGETWRRESLTSPKEALKLYRSSNPLALDLAELVNRTQKVFQQQYKGSQRVSGMIAPAIAADLGSNREELRPTLIRLLYRQAMYEQLCSAETQPIVKAMLGFSERLKAGEKGELVGFLAPSQNSELLDVMLKLPEETRSRMAPIYFSGNPKDGIVALVNPDHPELLFIIRVVVSSQHDPVITAELFPMAISRSLAKLSEGGVK